MTSAVPYWGSTNANGSRENHSLMLMLMSDSAAASWPSSIETHHQHRQKCSVWGRQPENAAKTRRSECCLHVRVEWSGDAWSASGCLAVYKRNKVGPRTEPWDNPYSNLDFVEWICCTGPLGYDLKQSRTLPSRLYDVCRHHRSWTSNVTLRTLSKAVSVEWCARYGMIYAYLNINRTMPCSSVQLNNWHRNGMRNWTEQPTRLLMHSFVFFWFYSHCCFVIHCPVLFQCFCW